MLSYGLENLEIYYISSNKKENQFLLVELKTNTCFYKSINDLITYLEVNYKDQVIRIKIDKISLRDFIYNFSISIYGVAYKPIEEKIFIEENKKYYNTYRKSILLKEIEKESYLGDSFKNIKELLFNLCNKNLDCYNYFCNWLAWILKKPVIKLPTAIIFVGEQGTGKTFFCEKILGDIFGSNLSSINQTQITCEFNNFIENTQLIVANEIVFPENQYIIPNKLKNFVSDEKIQINAKYRDISLIKNYSHWIFTSNADVPLKIEDKDRRYSVFYSSKLNNMNSIINNILCNYNEEICNFTSFILSLNPIFEEVSKPIKTDEKTNIKDHLNNSVQNFMDVLQELGSINSFLFEFDYFRKVNDNRPISYNFISENEIKISDFFNIYEKYCLFSRENVFSTVKFSMYLVKHYGFKKGRRKNYRYYILPESIVCNNIIEEDKGIETLDLPDDFI